LTQKNINQLTAKAAPIAGTELLNLAWKARSPQQAAIMTAFLGYSKKIVQATRWAAIIAREERKGTFPSGTFWRQLGPSCCDDVDLPVVNVDKCFSFQVFCKASSSWESLNSAERARTLKCIKNALRSLGVKVTSVVDKQPKEPKSIVRFDEGEIDAKGKTGTSRRRNSKR